MLQSAFGERGMTNQGVTMFDFFDDLRGQLASAGDLEEKLWDVVDGIGAAVGQQQDSGFRRIWVIAHGLLYPASRCPSIPALKRWAKLFRPPGLLRRPLHEYSFVQMMRGPAYLVLPECSCTNRVKAFTFSTGVSGRMP